MTMTFSRPNVWSLQRRSISRMTVLEEAVRRAILQLTQFDGGLETDPSSF